MEQETMAYLPARKRLDFMIPPERAGSTVDVLLRRTLVLSGTQVKRAKGLPDGILLDGQAVYVTARVQAGQQLSIRLEGGEPTATMTPTAGVVNLVYEDEDLLVVDKPAGLAVHPSSGHYEDTIGNILTWKYKIEPNFVFRAVNRLDRGTSGLMVVARHAHAQERLIRELHTGSFVRRYQAVCEGSPMSPSGRIDAPIGRMDGEVLRRQVRPDGAHAVTHYETMSTTNGRSLVTLYLETGRTHQIRVHMAYIGCPLTGDFLYGREDHSLISRTALHSAELALIQPITGERIALESPLPSDMGRLCAI